MTRLEKKREKLQGELNKAVNLSVEGFMWSDILVGVVSTIIAVSIFIWIPIIGWVAIPFTIVICPFMGTSIRQKQNTRQAEKLIKQISAIDAALSTS